LLVVQISAASTAGAAARHITIVISERRMVFLRGLLQLQ
jgi:hypothetical protein